MSLSVSGYIRQFYKGNVFGATANGRNGQPSYRLFSSDMKALRQAVRGLGDYDYNDQESDGEELVNKVKAFVNTYNNFVDSAKSMDDEEVDRYMSKLKKLTKGSAEELSDIGISIQNNGKLKIDEKTLAGTGRYEVSKLFSSDAEFSGKIEQQMKKTYNMMVRNSLNIPKQSTQSVKKTESGTQPPEVGDGTGEEEEKPPVQEDIELARQLVQALAGSSVDYTV
ncbi:MAG: hypothetical protein K2N87_04450 [Eubacterium sp.]|nr:hypothetical protein [Eubacterium sp.]